MKTNSEYIKNLKNKIITTSMLEEALFSVNKRAKNYRNIKRESYYQAYYNSAESKEQNFYKKKEKLLSVLEPVCIHREFLGFERTRIKSNCWDYDELYFQHLLEGDIVHENFYTEYDYELDCPLEQIHFFDYCDPSKPKYNYYLYYAIGEHTFHTPIAFADLEKYPYEIADIGRLKTEGYEPEELMSVQFVDKIISLIESKDFTLVKDKETVTPAIEKKVRKIQKSPKIKAAISLLKTEVEKNCEEQAKILSFSELDWNEFSLKRKQKTNGVKIIVNYPPVSHQKKLDHDKVKNFFNENIGKVNTLSGLTELFFEKNIDPDFLYYHSLRKTIKKAKEEIKLQAKEYPDLPLKQLPIYKENASQLEKS